MKILSVTAQKPDSTGSGVYLTELMRGFSRQGIHQALVCGAYLDDPVDTPQGTKAYPVYFCKKEERGGDPSAYDLPYPIAGMSDEMPYESMRYCDMTEEVAGRFCEAFRQKLRKAVDEFRPDLILCHHLYLVTALTREEFPDLPVWGICHGSDLRQLEKNPLFREGIKERIRRLDGIYCLHQAQKERIAADFSVGPERITILGSGYNAGIFHRICAPEGRPAKKDRRILLFAGKLSAKKGVMSLIRSLSMLKELQSKARMGSEAQMGSELQPGSEMQPGSELQADVELRLAGGCGNEAEYEEIRRLSEAAPYPVKLLGRLTQTELAREMNAADVFILPSFYEGLPLVILEAAACGAKVICTDLPGIRDWIERNVPDSGFRFVAPPPMRFADEPEEKELPAFEGRLARAVNDALAQEGNVPDVRHLSWDAICGRILNR